MSMYKSYYVLQKLSRYPQVVHAFSTRKSGDMEFVNGVEENGVNRRRFVEQFAIQPHRVVKMQQTHGTSIAHVNEANTSPIEDSQAIPGVDGLLTNDQRVYLFAKTADCMPILFFDPKQHVVGLAHVGWRGAVGKLPALMVADMIRVYGSSPQNITIGIGPALSKESSIIKGSAVQQLLPEWQEFVTRIDDSQVQVDLVGFTIHQLKQIGVPEANIESGGICTAQEADDFYSASAREEPERMGTVVGLRNLVA